MKESQLVINETQERAILVGLKLKHNTTGEIEEHMKELARLADSAGAEVCFSTIQERAVPHTAYLIGTGKVNELKSLVEGLNVNLVIFDDLLTPAQQRNLEEELNCKIVDREALILDIFAQRALTKEGKLQVELAQLEYLQPRLTRMWEHLSRLGGGIGTRGPGETQLEVDRRVIKKRIKSIKTKLEKIEKNRRLHRDRWQALPMNFVSLVGYTNAGKSTLLNRLTDSKAMTADKLFATLDPLVRRAILPSGRKLLMSDTVGFIRKLPPQLVAAFKSTLEQIEDADLIVHVIDAASEYEEEHIEVVRQILEELNVGHIPRMMVFNKVDLLEGGSIDRYSDHPMKASISAESGAGVPEMLEKIDNFFASQFQTVELELAFDERQIESLLYKHGKILEKQFHESGVTIIADIPKKLMGRLKDVKLKPIAGNH